MSNYGEKLRKERRSELAQRALPTDMFNEYGEVFAATKTEAGKSFPASDYAYVPDPDKPSTWKLRLTNTPGGDPDSQIVGAAVAALGAGFRGNKVQIPADALPAVKAKVKAAWIKANPDKDPKKDIPAVIAAGQVTEGVVDESKAIVACGDNGNNLELSVKVDDISATPSTEVGAAVSAIISAARIAYAGYDITCDVDIDVDAKSTEAADSYTLELDIDLDGISQTPSEAIKTAFDGLVSAVKSVYGDKVDVEVDIDVDSIDPYAEDAAPSPAPAPADNSPVEAPYGYSAEGTIEFEVEEPSISEYGTLPPALKAALVKKLTAQLDKEKDPKKKAEIQAKIDKYS